MKETFFKDQHAKAPVPKKEPSENLKSTFFATKAPPPNKQLEKEAAGGITKITITEE